MFHFVHFGIPPSREGQPNYFSLYQSMTWEFLTDKFLSTNTFNFLTVFPLYSLGKTHHVMGTTGPNWTDLQLPQTLRSNGQRGWGEREVNGCADLNGEAAAAPPTGKLCSRPKATGARDATNPDKTQVWLRTPRFMQYEVFSQNITSNMTTNPLLTSDT